MSYDIDFRVRVHGTNIYASVFDCKANITWNLRDMIVASTGLEWKNEENNGFVKDIIPAIQHGWEELELHPEKYKQYEAKNGWGTIAGCKRFFQAVIEDWNTFTLYYGEPLSSLITFWII